jgi:hypothetical protein
MGGGLRCEWIRREEMRWREMKQGRNKKIEKEK